MYQLLLLLNKIQIIMNFPVTYNEVLHRIDSLDVKQYNSTRNHLQGTVSYLSPYLTRGVITLEFILEKILSKYSFKDAYRFIYELAWREFFQRVWLNNKHIIWTDIKREQEEVDFIDVPKVVINAKTGIKTLDKAVNELYEFGYMHNHARMWIAGLVTNIGRTHWKLPSKWMYYYLLDGDVASNTLSWQWVAGTFSHRKYYFNQENINKYSNSEQVGTFVDTSYEELLATKKVPTVLQNRVTLDLQIVLPESDTIEISPSKPVLLYSPWTLDPMWRSELTGIKILVIEPSHLSEYPVSKRVMDFIIKIAKTNIPDINVFVGNIDDLYLKESSEIYIKDHPLTNHWPGKRDSIGFMAPELPDKKVGMTFTPFWKRVEKILKSKYT